MDVGVTAVLQMRRDAGLGLRAQQLVEQLAAGRDLLAESLEFSAEGALVHDLRLELVDLRRQLPLLAERRRVCCVGALARRGDRLLDRRRQALLAPLDLALE